MFLSVCLVGLVFPGEHGATAGLFCPCRTRCALCSRTWLLQHFFILDVYSRCCWSLNFVARPLDNCISNHDKAKRLLRDAVKPEVIYDHRFGSCQVGGRSQFKLVVLIWKTLVITRLMVTMLGGRVTAARPVAHLSLLP
jgi:hypothetical protein